MKLVKVCLLGMLLSQAVLAGEPEGRQKDIISVSGTGEVSAEPDCVYISAGVVSEGKTAADCYAANNRAMNSVKEGLLKFGVKKENIRSVQFNLHPRYDYAKGRGTLTGFQLTHVFSVKLQDPAKAGEAADAVVSSGANEISGISFVKENMAEVEKAAFELAYKNALEKAQVMAKAAGISLGRAVSIEERASNEFHREAGFGLMAAKSMDSAVPAPVSPGQLKVSRSINAVFEIKR